MAKALDPFALPALWHVAIISFWGNRPVVNLVGSSGSQRLSLQELQTTNHSSSAHTHTPHAAWQNARYCTQYFRQSRPQNTHSHNLLSQCSLPASQCQNRPLLQLAVKRTPAPCSPGLLSSTSPSGCGIGRHPRPHRICCPVAQNLTLQHSIRRWIRR
jgi:hypothetical protein